MSLLSVFNNARSSLTVTSQQSALVARNVANSGDPTATRKYANQIYDTVSSVEIRSISQSSDPALYRSLISAQASLGTNETLKTAFDRVRDVIGDVDASTSPSASIAALKDSLTELAASPENSQLQRAAVDSARDMATSLNNATKAVQTMRRDADVELERGAERLNGLLSELETLNNRVVSGTQANKDVTDEVDQRDRIVSDISSYVGVSVSFRANNDLVLSTDSGIMMFEKRARTVEFDRTPAFDPTVRATPTADYPVVTPPGEFKIDGVSIGQPSSMAAREGSLVAALKLRDDIGIEFQDRIDQTAKTLVNETFAEGPGQPGLFLLSTTGRVSISPDVDYRVGGNPALLRDGGLNGNAGFNTNGESGYADRLNTLISRFSDQHSFANGEVGTLGSYAAGSMSWFEGERSNANETASYQAIMVTRARDVLSNETGINLDEEMTRLLELERSYQASTKLIQTVGTLLDSLLALR